MKKTLNEYDVAKGMISQIKEMAKPVLKKKKMLLTEENASPTIRRTNN